MSYITDVKDFLCNNATISAAFGTTVLCGNSMYIGFEPNKPSNCITIFPYGGEAPEPNSKYKYNANVQVRVRATSFPVSYNTCQSIIDEMHYNTSVLASTNGIMYAMESQPIFLTRDENNRTIHVCNFRSKYVRYT